SSEFTRVGISRLPHTLQQLGEIGRHGHGKASSGLPGEGSEVSPASTVSTSASTRNNPASSASATARRWRRSSRSARSRSRKPEGSAMTVREGGTTYILSLTSTLYYRDTCPACGKNFLISGIPSDTLVL